MFRLLARCALLLASITVVALVLIRLRDYDGSQINQFFDSCTPMPCWQGIRPDETTTEEALDILHAHPWVDTVTEMVAARYASSDPTTLLIWTWSDAYPFASSTPVIQQGVIITEHGLVHQIYLTTGIPLGDIWLALGSPDGGTVDYIYDTRNLRIENTALFSQQGVAATTSIFTDCSMLFPNVWRTGVYMWLQDGASLGAANVEYPVYLNVLRRGYHQVRASFC